MANEKKTEKERSVEDRLKDLFQYQEYWTKIDSIKTQRGELPFEVKDLEDEIARYETRIRKHQEEITELRATIGQKKVDIEDRAAKIARYDEQINNVRNNREYAFLEKEKEYEQLEIQLDEKQIREAVAKQEQKLEEIDRCKEELTDKQHILEDKRKELEEILSETKQEEEILRAKAKELEPMIDERTLKAFNRIRKNARNGLGIVIVQRNACGGCFNRIPPQRQMEIKMHKKIIPCEYCGRIMVDGALVGHPEPEPEAPVKKTAKRSAR